MCLHNEGDVTLLQSLFYVFCRRARLTTVMLMLCLFLFTFIFLHSKKTHTKQRGIIITLRWRLIIIQYWQFAGDATPTLRTFSPFCQTKTSRPLFDSPGPRTYLKYMYERVLHFSSRILSRSLKEKRNLFLTQDLYSLEIAGESHASVYGFKTAFVLGSRGWH